MSDHSTAAAAPEKLKPREKRVLAILLTDALNLSGWKLSELSRTSGARLYPLIDKLEDAGLVAAEWEHATEPRRRFYRLTPEGRAWALTALGLKAGTP